MRKFEQIKKSTFESKSLYMFLVPKKYQLQRQDTGKSVTELLGSLLMKLYPDTLVRGHLPALTTSLNLSCYHTKQCFLTTAPYITPPQLLP